MKKIKILGTGCRKCEQLAENSKIAADQLGIPYELEKITEIAKIMDYGVMVTPAIAFDGEVKAAGKLLNPEEIKDLLVQDNEN